MSIVPGVDLAAVILAHAIGDYLIQSDWMANTKTERSGRGWWAAVIHGATYTVPFAFITTDPLALAVIGGTHVAIDHWRLARYFIWLRNWASPLRVRRGRNANEPRWVLESYNPPWSDCRATGFPSRRPDWLAVWLLFITDNLLHTAINVAAIWWAVGR